MSAAPPASPPGEPSRAWAWTKWLLRVAVSIALLGFVIARIDTSRFGALAARAHWGWWTFGLALVMLAPLATAQRSRLLIRALGHRVSLASVAAVNLEAIFFGLVFPGDLVAGVVRWNRFARYIGDRASALALLATERLIDWIMLALVTGAGARLLFSGPAAPRLRAYTVIIAAALATLGCVAILAGRSRSSELVIRGWRRRFGARVGAWLDRLSQLVTAGRFLTANKLQLMAVGLWTVAFWCVYCGGCLVMARAIFPQMPVLPYVAATAALTLLTQVPLTVAGVGLRELSLPIILGAHGVNQELGLLLGLSAFLPHMLLGMVGLLVRMSDRARLEEG